MITLKNRHFLISCSIETLIKNKIFKQRDNVGQEIRLRALPALDVAKKRRGRGKIPSGRLITAALIAALFCVTACSSSDNAAVNTDSELREANPPIEADASGEADASTESTPQNTAEELPKESFVNGMLDKMTLEEKVGQMFFCSFELDENGAPLTVLDDNTVDILKTYKIGGVIYFASNIDSIEQTIKLSEDFQKNSSIPLFIDVDEEGGRVTRITRSENMPIKDTPAAKTIGNTNNSNNAYTIYEIVANELKALGINTCFAPVADLNGDNEGVIGDRAFGNDGQTVGEFVVKSVEAFNDNGVISAVKHFPGHGIAPGDTHEEEIVSEKSLDEILSNDIIPFQMAANANVPMIMLSHITVPEWGIPASMSVDAVNYIRDTMGYNGIIITDSYRMGAITNYYPPETAAKNAIGAGVDILLMPENLDIAVKSVLAAVENNEISIDAIDSSVKRILSAKYDYSLFSDNNPEKYREILDGYIKQFNDDGEPFFSN